MSYTTEFDDDPEMENERGMEIIYTEAGSRLFFGFSSRLVYSFTSPGDFIRVPPPKQDPHKPIHGGEVLHLTLHELANLREAINRILEVSGYDYSSSRLS